MAIGIINNLYVGSFADGNGKEDGYDISNLHFDFEVARSIKWYENYAKYKIFNASLDTIEHILYEGAGIIHEFGYEDEPNGKGNIFVGNVSKAWCEKVGNNVITHLVCTSTRGPEYQLTKVPLALGFKAGSDMLTILKTVADWCAMPLIGADSLADVTIDDDFSYSGPSTNACLKNLNALLDSMGCGRVYFDNSVMVYMDDSGSDEDLQAVTNVSLDYSSGLISASPIRETDDGLLKKDVEQNLAYYYFGGVSPVNTKKGKIGKGKKSKKYTYDKSIEYKPIAEAANRRNKVKFKSLINPGLVPNTRVNIDNSQEELPMPIVKGSFLIRSVTFKGNNYGGACAAEGEAVE